MNRIALEEPRFTQSQVLQIVPALTARTLQNWIDRGIVETSDRSPGYGNHRRYTALGVVQLAFMASIVELGMGPGDARELAHSVAAYALQLHATYPAQEENGRLVWRAFTRASEAYYRGYIVKRDGKLQIIWRMSELGVARTLLPAVYATVEIDLLVLFVLDRLYAFLAGHPLPDRLPMTVAPEDRESLERFAKMIPSFSQPEDEK